MFFLLKISFFPILYYNMYKQDVNELDPRLEVKFYASQRGDAAASSTDSPNLRLSSTDLRCFMSADLAVCSAIAAVCSIKTDPNLSSTKM